MVSVQTPHGGRELPYARVLVLPAIVMAAVTGAAVAVVTEPARAAVGWCGGIATLLVTLGAAEALRRGRDIGALRAELARRSARLDECVASQDAQFRRLGQEIVPESLDRMRAGYSPDEVIREVIDTHPEWRELPDSQRLLIRQVLRVIDREDTLRDSLQRSFVNIARRVQAIIHQQANEVREMEEDHGRNPEVFDDLLRIDHGNALISRLADSIAVLGGSRPGRQWPVPVPLYSVLRGALSRILEYRRIELHSVAKVNIRGISVEPILHAAAELLDNATRYSPPHTKVHVTAHEVQSGIAVEIEDSGTGLNAEGRARIERIIEEAKRAEDLQGLADSPQLGLAVVGRLCTAYNMQVSLRQSAYGGVRAVLVLPHVMVTDEPAFGVAHGVGVQSRSTLDNDGVNVGSANKKNRRPTTGPRIPGEDDYDEDVPVVTEWTPNGLPQRRSRISIPLDEHILNTYAAAERAEKERAEKEARTAAARAVAAAPEKPEKEEPLPGMWVEAFMEGLKSDPDPNAFTRKDEPADAEAGNEGDLK
ncbi:sensor histidine kinase [Streptomyces griseoaurantiacus]|uniref:sensor histidine kinase n=1 Tax=Streptomyces griseoaurantiacus TaxID=68213 RepID=UPI00345FC6FF